MRGIVLGTGPSVTERVIERLNETDLPIFGCNNTYQIAPLKALLSCNSEWWEYYWERDAALRGGKFDKWTWDKTTADKYGLNHVRGEWGDGLSTDPAVIHYGHSSGYQLLNLAYHYGVTEAILIGYDLRYPKGYSGAEKRSGGDRHYFGEYPEPLQHWTRSGMGASGELGGLLACYQTIKPEEYGIRIINCSPGTALDFFELGDFFDETEND